MRSINVVILAYPDLCTFEFGLAVELFALPRPEEKRWYSTVIAAEQVGKVQATGGVCVAVSHDLDALEALGAGDLVVIPGWTAQPRRVSNVLCQTLRDAHRRGVRLASICSGAFLLAECGLLDGKSATTHWRYEAALAGRFPSVCVKSNALYTEADAICTSAGSAAGLDLGLHIISQDFGMAAANRVAKRLVVPRHRDGGQRQFIDVEKRQASSELAELMDAVESDLSADWTVAKLAREAKMSERTLARRFREEADCTPQQWVRGARVAAARRLLETSKTSIAGIAELSGFGSEEALRLHFGRTLGVPPTRYRTAFNRTSA